MMFSRLTRFLKGGSMKTADLALLFLYIHFNERMDKMSAELDALKAEQVKQRETAVAEAAEVKAKLDAVGVKQAALEARIAELEAAGGATAAELNELLAGAQQVTADIANIFTPDPAE